jgi:hypothetical protein
LEKDAERYRYLANKLAWLDEAIMESELIQDYNKLSLDKAIDLAIAESKQ